MKNDQMPKNICSLCVDKINDFYEYREMCWATNSQTRKLLGIPEPVVGKQRKRKLNVSTPLSFMLYNYILNYPVLGFY